MVVVRLFAAEGGGRRLKKMGAGGGDETSDSQLPCSANDTNAKEA